MQENACICWNMYTIWFCWRKRRSSTSSSSDSDDERGINKRIEEARRRDEERKWLEMERLRLAYVNYCILSHGESVFSIYDQLAGYPLTKALVGIQPYLYNLLENMHYGCKVQTY